ncbi:MAG: tRNA ((18)-2-O)-methyltransferase [Bacteroidetes bacterium]|jgi:tRNA G18 (ribose-2'-O)-methylase SpoU|nr:tRNA ((18)-2-O)-methyltransferase [Bacteroidota bacterium]
MKKLANEALQRKTVEEFKQASKNPLIIVLDNIRSLNNVGSAFRTADAFLLEAVYLCGVTGTPPNPEIHKTALGATDTVSWKHFKSTVECIAELKQQGYTICSVEQAERSVMLHELKKYPEKKYALVFGNEVYGVEQEVIDSSDLVIEIPQFGSKHSLNVSVSIGIVCWELVR